MKFLFLITARHKSTGFPFCGTITAETVPDAFFLLCQRYGYTAEECTLRASVQYNPENKTS